MHLRGAPSSKLLVETRVKRNLSGPLSLRVGLLQHDEVRRDVGPLQRESLGDARRREAADAKSRAALGRRGVEEEVKLLATEDGTLTAAVYFCHGEEPPLCKPDLHSWEGGQALAM